MPRLARAAAPGRWSCHDLAGPPHLPALLRCLRVYRWLPRPEARRLDQLLRCVSLSAPALAQPGCVPWLGWLAGQPWRACPSQWPGGELSSLVSFLTGIEPLPEPPERDPVFATLSRLSHRYPPRWMQYRPALLAPRAEWEGGVWVVGGVRWQLVQLLSRGDLSSEGRLLQHCVASYWPRASSGLVSLWSLRRGRDRTLTIEVANAQRTIVQARGLRNRRPLRLEAELVERWAQERGLVVGGGVLAL